MRQASTLLLQLVTIRDLVSLFLFLSAVTLVTRQANRIARVLRSITKLRKASRKWERMSQRSAKDKNRLGSDNVSASAYSGFRLYEERESDRCATGSLQPVGVVALLDKPAVAPFQWEGTWLRSPHSSENRRKPGLVGCLY